jgi:hypothetical protein
MALMELAYWSSGPCSSCSGGRRRRSSIHVGALGASVVGFVAAATSGGPDHLLLLLPLMVVIIRRLGFLPARFLQNILLPCLYCLT